MGVTKIPWADRSWNPLTGCTKISAGCVNCYAHAIHQRFGKGRPFDVTFHEDRLDEPLGWKKPARVFVCSMSDLFHEDVTDKQIAAVFDVIRACFNMRPDHQFIILTKRPERMRSVMKRLRFDGRDGGQGTYIQENDVVGDYPLGVNHRGSTGLTNVCLGVSVENQQAADERIPILLDTPAAVRLVSLEPLIGPVSIPRYALGVNAMCDCAKSFMELGMPSIEPDFMIHAGCPQCGKKYSKTTGINWLIVGAESGPGARPCDPSWVRSIIKQGTEADVPLFVKQWRDEDCTLVKMPRIDGKVYAQFPDRDKEASK